MNNMRIEQNVSKRSSSVSDCVTKIISIRNFTELLHFFYHFVRNSAQLKVAEDARLSI